MRFDTESLNETTLEVPWEPNLGPGPVGEYIEVVDVDPASNACYAPVDLDHPHLLASDGLDPAEGVPQFHQRRADGDDRDRPVCSPPMDSTRRKEFRNSISRWSMRSP